MAKATEKQLKERWLTPEGKKVRQQIIEHIREDNWVRFLEGFPFFDEVENGIDLRFINLMEVDLGGANLCGANLGFANLVRATLGFGNLRLANLCGADLYGANLRLANLCGADLVGADLGLANLGLANLCGANLVGADLWGADLYGANLRLANLCGADLSTCHLIRTDISGADLTDVYIYGISTWDIKTDEKTIMKNLIISKDPLITVGDIEIAQFMNLIINNKKITNIITSMRTKGVLILGSFDDKSMPVLNKLTEILPKYDLVPMIFYFKAPKEHRFMETVRTMALLSKFVIVDLSKKSSQLYEIAKLVDNIKVPYATIAVEGTKVSGMLEDLHDYYWYGKEYFPYPENGWENQLPELVKDKIIPWADEINKRLMENRDRGY